MLSIRSPENYSFYKWNFAPFGNKFLDIAPKAQVTKTILSKKDNIKLESFHRAKEKMIKM